MVTLKLSSIFGNHPISTEGLISLCLLRESGYLKLSFCLRKPPFIFGNHLTSMEGLISRYLWENMTVLKKLSFVFGFHPLSLEGLEFFQIFDFCFSYLTPLFHKVFCSCKTQIQICKCVVRQIHVCMAFQMQFYSNAMAVSRETVQSGAKSIVNLSKDPVSGPN